MPKSLKPPANAPTASLKSPAKKKKPARKAPTASLKPPQ
jgi:hypothetical protein